MKGKVGRLWSKISMGIFGLTVRFPFSLASLTERIVVSGMV